MCATCHAGPIFKKHALTEIRPTKIAASGGCREHGNQPMLYCESDRVAICVLCLETSEHKSHLCKSLASKAEESRAGLVTKMSGLRARVAELRGSQRAVEDRLTLTRQVGLLAFARNSFPDPVPGNMA